MAHPATMNPGEAVTKVMIHLNKDRFDKWYRMLHSARRFESVPVDTVETETPLGTLTLEVREASNRGGAYLQAVLKNEGEVEWKSRCLYRIGEEAPATIGASGKQIELTIEKQ